MEHINLAKGISNTSIDSKELNSIYKGIEFIIKNKYKTTILHGLSFELCNGVGEWVATSVEFKSEKWKKLHCHGMGKTPENAIKDMVRKIKKNEEEKNISC